MLYSSLSDASARVLSLAFFGTGLSREMWKILDLSFIVFGRLSL